MVEWANNALQLNQKLLELQSSPIHTFTSQSQQPFPLHVHLQSHNYPTGAMRGSPVWIDHKHSWQKYKQIQGYYYTCQDMKAIKLNCFLYQQT